MRTPLVVALGLVVLAATAILVVSKRSGPEGPLGPDGKPARSVVVLEGTAGGAAKVIQVIEPGDGTRMSRDELREASFRWRTVDGAQRYLFVATNEIGQLVWRSMVSDTVTTLPDKVIAALIDGDRLKWMIQAPHVSASTDIHRVEVAP